MRINSVLHLALAVRGRRDELGLTQGALAKKAGVSREWVNQVEAGKPTAEFGKILVLIDALDLTLWVAPNDDPQLTSPPSLDLDSILDRYRDS